MTGLAATLTLYVLLAVCIAIHEYGHYRVGLYYKMPVLSFSIGLGPRIFSWTDSHGVPINLRLFPLGGFVRFELRSIPTYPTYQQVAVFAAGPLMNIAAIVVAIAIAALTPIMGHDMPLWRYMVYVATNVPVLIVGGLLEPFTAAYWHNTFAHGNLVGAQEIVSQRFAQMTLEQAMLQLWLWFVSVNASLAAFNLLPMPPLDGGQIVLALIRRIFSGRVGKVLGVGLMVAGGSYVAMVVVSLVGADIWRLIERIVT